MKKILSVVLAIVMTCSAFPMMGYAQDIDQGNGQGISISKNEMTDIVADTASIESDSTGIDNLSIDEVAQLLDSVEGIENSICEEKSASIDEAIDEVFDPEYDSAEADDIITSEDNGVQYTIEVYNTSEGNYVRTYSDDGLHMSNIEVIDDAVSVDSYIYDYDNGCYDNQTVTFECVEDEYDYDYESDLFEAQAIKYGGKKNSAKWKKKIYWYQVGSEKKKTYLKIGQKANYRIRTDNLSKAKSKKCDAYTSAVKKSQSYYNKGTADIAGTSFSTGVIIGMIIANAAFPPSVIIDSVLAALGAASIKLAVSGVKNYVNSFEKWKDASDYYVIIRTYGMKL